MSWYYGTFSCGHEGRVNIIGPVKDREWKANRAFSGLCPECKEEAKKERLEQLNMEAAENAKKLNLPELTGTEKQVSWANTIRQKCIDVYEEFLEKAEKNPREWKHYEITREEFAAGMDHILQRTSASWWIDNRHRFSVYSIPDVMKKEYQLMVQEKKKYEEEKFLEETSIDAVVRPENPVTETIADIRIGIDSVEIVFPERRDDFRKIVKERLRMTWDGKWVRKLNKRNGAAEDRAAEAGHVLLGAGFVIRILDDNIRRMAVDGNYEPECTRWVTAFVKGDLKGKLAISWDRKTEDFYDVARRLPGSRWRNPTVVVPPENYDEVLDFADRYNFRISEAAQKIIEEAREAKERALVVDVDPIKQKKFIADTKPQKLEVPEEVEIDEELRDKD